MRETCWEKALSAVAAALAMLIRWGCFEEICCPRDGHSGEGVSVRQYSREETDSAEFLVSVRYLVRAECSM